MLNECCLLADWTCSDQIFKQDVIFCRKDARLPELLQRAMAAEAEATREARAKVIAADGEKRASRALREASNVIDESPSALQLRYLQVTSSSSLMTSSTVDDVVVVIDVVNVNDWWVDDDGQCDQI